MRLVYPRQVLFTCCLWADLWLPKCNPNLYQPKPSPDLIQTLTLSLTLAVAPSLGFGNAADERVIL